MQSIINPFIHNPLIHNPLISFDDDPWVPTPPPPSGSFMILEGMTQNFMITEGDDTMEMGV